MSDALLKRAALLAAVGVSALGSLGLLAWMIFDQAVAMDFGVYWRAANEPLRAVYLERATLNFPYPPTMLLWIAPLALTQMWHAYVAWLLISIALFWAACRRHLTRAETCLALISVPVVYCVLNGQVALALTGILLWAFSTGNRVTAGIGLAVVASIKPQFVLLAPLMLVVTKDWRALASSVLVFSAIVAISLFFFGFHAWAEWLNFLDHFHKVVVRNGVLMVAITPASAAERWGLPPQAFVITGAALGTWLVVKCRHLATLQKATAVAAGSLISAPYAVIYDLTAVVPFTILCAFRGQLLAPVVLSGGLNPLPLLITAFQLRNDAQSRKCAEPMNRMRSLGPVVEQPSS